MRSEIQVVGGVSQIKQVKEVKATNWLETADMLPKVIPRARIMRFGYESCWFGETAVNQRLLTIAQALLQCLVTEREVSLCPIVLLKPSLVAERYRFANIGQLYSSVTI
jgi:hypothetical protein